MKIDFTIDEIVPIRRRLLSYGVILDTSHIKFYWTNFLFKDTCGSFRFPNKIYLNIKDKLAILDGVADDVICHELYHAKQYKEQGWLKYSLLNLTKINEIEAYAEQERVRMIIEGNK